MEARSRGEAVRVYLGCPLCLGILYGCCAQECAERLLKNGVYFVVIGLRFEEGEGVVY